MTTDTSPHSDRLNHLVEAITFRTIMTQTIMTLSTQTTTIMVTTTITAITTITIRTIMDPIWLGGPVTMEIIMVGVCL